jgi:predicted DNA repair protein MutK
LRLFFVIVFAHQNLDIGNRLAMTKSTKKLTPKVMFLASLGIVIPLLILGIAFLAVKSDAKNQEEYQRIKEEQQQRIQEKLATEKQFTQQEASSAVSK